MTIVSIVKQNEIIEKMGRNEFYQTVLNRIEMIVKEKHQVWANTTFTSDILEQIAREDISDFEKLQQINILTFRENNTLGSIGEFAERISGLVGITGAGSCNWCSEPFLSSELPKMKRLDTDLLYHDYCYDLMKLVLKENNSEGIKE